MTRRQDIYASRRRAVMRQIRSEKADAMLALCPVDVAYLTGFTGDDSWLLLGDGWADLVTDGRYGEQAAGECPGVDIHVRQVAMAEVLGIVCKSRKVRRMAFQASHMTVATAGKLGDIVGAKRMKGVSGVVSRLRAVKDETEIRVIRKAQRIASEAFKALISVGRSAFVGKTERQVAADLEHLMRSHGADKAAFDTIVAAGAHSSLPHYLPGETVITRDQAVLLDWGALVNGYRSDLTRVVFTGRIPAKIGEIYEIVHRAQKAGINAVRPGVAAKSVDKAARDVIAEAGYADRFIHGVGHGLGREVHEAPSVGRLSTARLKKGMVITVEPGIYLPGVGGVRIEDDIHITTDGRRRVGSLPSDIRAVTLR